MRVKKECLICEKFFYIRYSILLQGRGKFCSNVCRGKWISKHRIGKNHPNWKGGEVKKICKQCGKEFYVKTILLKKGYGKFCSQKCMGIWCSKNLKGENSPFWKGGKITQICIICKKKFKVIKSKIINGEGKFCSRECQGIWQSKYLSGKNSKLWKKIKVKCIICGKKFDAIPSNIKKGYSKYCSRGCKGIGGRDSNSHFWKDGATSVYDKIRKSKKYNTWRKSVFERDNYTCQNCNTKSAKGNPVYLHAHHIKRFSFILNDMKQKYPLLLANDLYEGYSDLWNINNGITLCVKCHKLKHKKQLKKADRITLTIV